MPLTNLIPGQIEMDGPTTAELAKRLLAKIPRTKSGMLKEDAWAHQAQVIFDTAGKKWDVWIRLEAVLSGASGGHHSKPFHHGGVKYVNIELNDAIIARQLGLMKVVVENGEPQGRLGEGGRGLNEAERARMDTARFSVVYSLLLHELTHARDADPEMEGLEMIESWDNASPEQKASYVNQPPETRALLNQLVDDLQQLSQPGDTAESALNRSLWWRDYLGAYLPADKKAEIVARVAAWLEKRE